MYPKFEVGTAAVWCAWGRLHAVSPLSMVTKMSAEKLMRRKMMSGPEAVVRPAITFGSLSAPHKYLTPVTTAVTDELGKVTEESRTRLFGGSLSVVWNIS